MKIEEVKEYTNDLHEGLNSLLPQLSSSASLLLETELNEIIGSDSSRLIVVTEEGCYLGSLTLAIFRIPTGKRAWVEDVVVSEGARGKGVGRALMEYAITLANELGAKTVDLTSRPSREAANALYKKVGFKVRETNVYRYENRT